MPELPQVEALAEFLRANLVGQTIKQLEWGTINTLKTFDPPADELVDRTVTAVNRWGKHIDVVTSAAGSDAGTGGGDSPGAEQLSTGVGADGAPSSGTLHLVFHLARAGWLVWREQMAQTRIRPGKSPISLRVRLADGAGFDLTEAGTQRKLAVWVVRDPQQVPGIATLGPDPMAPQFTMDVLRSLLDDAARAQLKGVLRNQRVIAGIGNAYSDEILHAAKLSPFKAANSLDQCELQRLHSAIRDGLTAAVERARGLAAKDIKADKRAQLRIHAHAGDPCPVCGTAIASVSFADSSLEYCPHCQTGDKLLADRRMSRLLK